MPERETMLIDALKLAGIGVWEMDLESGDLRFSEEAYRILGLNTSMNIVDRAKLSSIVHPDDRGQATQEFLEGIDKNQPFEGEFRIILPDNSIRYIYRHGTPVMDESGKVTKAYGIFQNITDRKLTEAALLKSREEMDKIANGIPLVLYIFNIQEKKTLYINHRSFTSLGYKGEEIIAGGAFMASIVHPEDVPVLRGHLERLLLLQDDESVEVEYRMKHKQGHWVWYESSERIFSRDAQGKVLEVIGCAQDITLRKQSQQLILENSQLLNGLLAHLPVVTYKLDKDGTITLSKGAGLAGLGFKEDGMVGINIWSSYPNLAHHFRKAFELGEYSFLSDGDGHYADRNFQHFLFRDDIQDEGLVGFAFDITAQKLVEQKLIEEKNRIEEVAEVKQRFVSSISHEIRTPMNGIIGMADILNETSLDDEQRQYLSLIKESANNLLVIVNDILDFSKLSAGMMVLNKEPFNIQEMISSLVKLLKPKAVEKGLKFSVTIDAEIPKMLIGDQVRLRQVLTNLLGNALKFTEKGEVQLTLRLLEIVDSEATVEFRVRDTGVGIPQEQQEHIFGNFIQIVDTNRKHYSGTGLGLSIARQLVEAQGGTIQVESELGKGAEFRFALKLEYEADIAKKGEQPTTNEETWLSGLRVLLVEDNLINQRVAQVTLEKMGARIDIAGNGQIALDFLAEQTYDLIIMDIQMPVMDGFEATAHIRSSPKDIRKIPIIAMTAGAMKGDRERCLAAGMDGFVAKPINRQEVKETIDEVLQLKKVNGRRNKLDFDLSYLEEISNDKAFIDGIIQDFLEQTPQKLEELASAIEQNQVFIIKEIAHRLKSSYLILGIHRLEKAWWVLENMKQADNNQAARTAFDEIKSVSESIYQQMLNR
ncbi:MAG: PAS domain-containing protein [Chitinophagales bacterium]|nr:PAS domain-containing protein [Chitinophagales bacterium]